MKTNHTTKKLYKDTFNRIHPSEHSVNHMLYNMEEKEMKAERFLPRRRVIAMTMICCMLFASVAFAASKIATYERHAPSSPQCTEYSELPDLTKELAYDPIVPQSFDNGYTFQSATLGTETGKDAEGNTVASVNILDIVYSHPRTGDITLSIDPLAEDSDEGRYEKTRSVNGVTVGGSAFIIKFVPPDYEKTDEDIARVKNGTIQISYGTDTVEESSYSSASFAKDEVQYTLLADGDKQPTMDELMDMAEEMLK